jgi:hypothetical protein
MKPLFQERFQVYVMGPNQDARLALIAPGATVEKIEVKIDLDAPFVLRRRALGPDQAGLYGLKTKWTGATGAYRQTVPVLETLQQPYFGLIGSPKPVSPDITYPPAGTISLDLENTSASPITNLIFYWIGVSLYPWGYLPAPTYPAEFRGETFAQPFIAQAMGAPEIRLNQIFTAKSDGDLVLRAGQAGSLGTMGNFCPPVFQPGVFALTTEMSIVMRDYNRMPYMNDWVDINVLFGASAFFGMGPGHPGIIYPEIYLPAQRQLLIDVQQSAAGVAGADLLINFIGAKIFKGAR